MTTDKERLTRLLRAVSEMLMCGDEADRLSTKQLRAFNELGAAFLALKPGALDS